MLPDSCLTVCGDNSVVRLLVCTPAPMPSTEIVLRSFLNSALSCIRAVFSLFSHARLLNALCMWVYTPLPHALISELATFASLSATDSGLGTCHFFSTSLTAPTSTSSNNSFSAGDTFTLGTCLNTALRASLSSSFAPFQALFAASVSNASRSFSKRAPLS